MNEKTNIIYRPLFILLPLICFKRVGLTKRKVTSHAKFCCFSVPCSKCAIGLNFWSVRTHFLNWRNLYFKIFFKNNCCNLRFKFLDNSSFPYPFNAEKFPFIYHHFAILCFVFVKETPLFACIYKFEYLL